MHKAVEDYLAIKAYKREQRKRKIDALLRILPIKPSTMAKLAVCILAIAFGLWLTKLFVENNTKTRRQIAASAEANAKWQAREKLELAELSKGPAWVRWMQDAEHRKQDELAGTRTPIQLWCDSQIERDSEQHCRRRFPSVETDSRSGNTNSGRLQQIDR